LRKKPEEEIESIFLITLY